MSFERGGYADKLGNQFEWRWVVKQLLLLLQERVAEVCIEATGPEGQGVDLWLRTPDGRRLAHQCKARNGSEEKWRPSDLNARGVLESLGYHVDRDEVDEFHLVSAVPCTSLGDICESARQSSGDPGTFIQDQIDASGEDRRKTFQQFCKFLHLDRSAAQDQVRAFRYLRRFHITLWADDRNSQDDLFALAALLADGQPETIVSVLTEFAQSHLRHHLVAGDVWQHLSARELRPRRLAHDARVVPAVESLNQRFYQSISGGLIDGSLIPRKETSAVLHALTTHGIVILHGRGGRGKSGVMFELWKTLQDHGHPCVPVRLHTVRPKISTRQFGADLGLPESPALCLDSLTSDKLGVLFLDQLDALRWTRAHSQDALDVCKTLVREIRTLRQRARPVSVVLACRTYDLESDPEIAGWLDDPTHNDSIRIEVQTLDEEVVKHTVASCHGDWSTLGSRAREILSTPSHLALWVKLARKGTLRTFHSAVQLMRQFWDSVYRDLDRVGMSSDQVKGAVDVLVDYMEKHGTSVAPASLVADRVPVIDALQSCGILRSQSTLIGFDHQTYFDFQVASRLAVDLHNGKTSLLEWLNARSQDSLLRREHLRQLLSLLLDDAPDTLISSVQAVMHAPQVRFHLRHVVLEFLGQLEHPDETMSGYLLTLLNDHDLREHALETVYWGHPQHILVLSSHGTLGAWAASADSKQVDVAFSLLRSVAAQSPDLVVSFLEQHADRIRDLSERALGTLCWNACDDSERMFELRLSLARRGLVQDWVNWAELGAKSPDRAIRLLEAQVSSWNVSTDVVRRDSHRSRLENWAGDIRNAFLVIATTHPEAVWDRLTPQIDRLTYVYDEDDPGLVDWEDGDDEEPRLTGARRGLVEMAIAAGRWLAGRQALGMGQRVTQLRQSPSRITQLILAETLAAFPQTYSDDAIDWLMADPRRLALGSGHQEPKWMPAARIIEAHSGSCSADRFENLQEGLLKYWDPKALRSAKFWARERAIRLLGNGWGMPQLFLLPALAAERRSRETEGFIATARRKFEKYAPWRFLDRAHHTGGWVGSPLTSDRVERLSDAAWLRIVGSDAIPVEDHGFHRQIGPERLAESSVRTFSADLGRMAKRFPERFGRLALTFPPGTKPAYYEAILEGLGRTTPEALPADQAASWKPAAPELIISLISRLQLVDDRGLLIAACRMFQHRSEEEWPIELVTHVIRCARTSSDPKPSELSVWSAQRDGSAETASIDDLVTNTLNCVRAVGARTVGALLRSHPEWFPQLRADVEAQISDPHPVVRLAALEGCLSILAVHRDLAIDWFCTAVRDDLRVAAAPIGRYFFNAGFSTREERLGRIVRQMLACDEDDVVREGAREVAARWLLDGRFDEELESCLCGTVPQREGIADVTSQFLLEAEFTAKTSPLVAQLLNDDVASVRQHASQAFNNERVFSIPEASAVLAEYVNSEAFADAPSPFLYAIGRHAGPLCPFSGVILKLCETFAMRLRERANGPRREFSADAHEIPPLLLRLYGEALQEGHPETLIRCLDAWDLLFQHRVGIVRDLSQAIDA